MVVNLAFDGKKVLVTGASSGIGFGIAKAFAEAGASVVLAARHLEKLKSNTARLRQTGLKVEAVQMDVSVEASVQLACEEAADKLGGGIDILCANAGIFPTHTLDEMTSSDWDHVMDVNARGTFFCVRYCIPFLRNARQPRIVLTSSITGPITGIGGLSHYGASKAAQLGFMRSAAIELAKDGITVNAILPGVIETESLLELGNEFIEQSARLVPIGRLGTPFDIANGALFLASEQSGFITGQTIVIDGGQTLPEAM
ncbi:MAG: SDR family oxidoreductase [Rhizobium pusense]|nr:SDR family oxidoreductase [Agrobacterium pusense]